MHSFSDVQNLLCRFANSGRRVFISTEVCLSSPFRWVRKAGGKGNINHSLLAVINTTMQIHA